MKFTVVVPAHNEEKNIGDVLSALDKVKQKYIVVDDGSADDTYKVAKKYKGKVLRHKINLGKGAAMKTGAEAAFSDGTDAVIFMDSDGQHRIEDLQSFKKEIEAGHPFIVGTRNLSYGVPLVRYLGNKFASLLVAFLFRIYVSDLLCGFRAMTKKTYKKIKWDSSGYGVETEMIVNAAKSGINVKEVPIMAVYHDALKGVTILDAANILFDVIFWRLKK
jgi:glycosyltransferase involved in cell wall biosynthesis